MTCVKIPNGFMCFANVYEMEHAGKTYLFEWHDYLGPMELRKTDHEPRKRNQAGFFDTVSIFCLFSKERREKYRYVEK